MRIILLGMRGSGKSAVGKILSRKLGWKYIETDALIEKEAGLNISQLVSRFGWQKFRRLEARVIQRLKNVDRAVIATGGGVVLSEKNMRTLKNNSLAIWLQASIKTLTQRCQGDVNRPFLTENKSLMEDLVETLRKRKKLYNKYADFSVNNENKSAIQSVKEINKRKICCIIGHPVSHSLSPALHNFAYKALGLNWIFLSFDVTDLRSCIKSLRDLKIRGAAVTVPYKIKIMSYLDKVSQTAKKIGAVNTIIRSQGKLIGTNTDWSGATNALSEKTTLEGKGVALIGAGGAARAIAYGLKKEGSKVSVFNRNIAHAKSLMKDLELNSCYPLSESSRIKKFDIVINATPVGMNENKSPLKQEAFTPNQLVFDIVYRPRITVFLKMAKRAGCSIITGDRMLLHCAIKQFELFTDQKVQPKIMERMLVC